MMLSESGLLKLIGVSTTLVYANVGLCVALIGPTLLDLIQMTGVSWDRMGVLMMMRGVFTVCGTILANLLANLPVTYLMGVQALAHLLILISQFLIPLCVSEAQIIGIFVIEGVCIGLNTNLCNFLTVTVQKRSAHAWIQTMFMIKSIALLLAPLMATPFLSEEAARKQSLQSCNITRGTRMLEFHRASGVDLRVPYWISAGLCGVAVVLYLAAILASWNTALRKRSGPLKGPESKAVGRVVMGYAVLLSLLYFLLEGICMRFIFSFAVKSKLCLSVTMGGLISTLFGAATCVMRGCSAIAVAYKPNLVKPKRLIIMNHACLSIALVTILIGRDSFLPAVWIFAFFSGLGVSNLFPSLMALTKGLGASKRVLTLLPMGGMVGVTIGPLVTTFLMDEEVAGPGQGFYIVYCIAVHLSTLLFAALTSALSSSSSSSSSNGHVPPASPKKTASPELLEVEGACKIAKSNGDSP